MRVSPNTLILALAVGANAFIGIADWSMTNVPSAGLMDITFPMAILEADHIYGYYLAKQFTFINGSAVGYTGLQPHPDGNGKSVLHAAFSSFIDGTTSTDANCHDGADGGAGVSCSVDWNGVYGRTYNLEVVYQLWSGHWVGTVVDTVTHARVHIGSYKLPSGVGGITSSQVGFVEWYPWNGGEPPDHCAKLPYQKTFFGDPTTTHRESKGTVDLPYEVGDCQGQVDFSAQKVAGGVEVECGFKGQTGEVKMGGLASRSNF
ncbi:beta-glucan synthesis-associated [Favolaschia claudopus]|uniref:Beta-glucan synthesis-associated n=1 Tax=Favolaschia claudopus TaxID=2862362 RepID=A0AAW0DEK8_9AGAR